MRCILLVLIGIALFLAAMLPTQTSAAQLVIGQVAPMSGLDANQGRAYAIGMQLFFDEVNKTASVNGHTFMLVRKDDRGRPEDTVALTRAMLIEQRPIALAGYFGNANIDSVIAAGLLEKERIALVGYRASEVRSDMQFLYSVRAGVREELGKLTEHLAIVGIKRLGLLYEDSAGAAALISVADAAASRVGISFVARASYAPNTVAVAPAVDVFNNMQPQAIIIVSTGAAAAAFVERYKWGGGAAHLFAYSGVDIEQLSKRLSEGQMQSVAISQVTPSPYKISNRLTKQFIEAASKTPNLEVPVSYTMMEGYIAARVIAEAVRRQGPRPTREGFLTAINSLDHLDLGGYVIGFKGQRIGSTFVELSIVSGVGKIRR